MRLALIVILLQVTTSLGLSQTTNNGFVYTSASNQSKIVDYVGGSGGALIVPTNLGGFTVTRIEDQAFQSKTNITSILTGDGLLTIGQAAFGDCANLRSVVISSPVTSIGDYAFQGCGKLSNVVIPASVTNLGQQTFFKNSALSSITLPAGLGSLGRGVFQHCVSLTNVVLPPALVSIGDLAFGDCTNLPNITFPETLGSLGSYAFQKCLRLTNVSVPNSVTNLGIQVFGDCNRLAVASIGSGVTNIPMWTFYNCPSLVSVSMGINVKMIENAAFGACSNLANIVFPASLEVLGPYSFYNCTKLSSLLFHGNAPTYDASNSFLGAATDFTVYIMPETTGWQATFAGRPVQLYSSGEMPTITSTTFFTGRVGAVFSNAVTASGSAPIFFDASNLPSGLSVSANGVITGVPTTAGTNAAILTASNAYGVANQPATFVIAKGTPVVGNRPAASSITYGQALADSVLTGGSANVEGSFGWMSPTDVPPAGTNTPGVTFTPVDQANYEQLSTNITLVVERAIPAVTWSNPAPIVYGTMLSAAQFNATSGAVGTFAYSPAIGTTLPAGTNTLTAVFTAADSNNYVSPLTNTVSLVVDKAPASVVLGSLSQVYDGNPKTVTGITTPQGLGVALTYDGSQTAPVNAGTYVVVAQILDANYEGTTNGTLVVDKAVPALGWTPNPVAPLTYPAPLGPTQLNATASVSGTFAYDPADGTVLDAGTNTLVAVFSPADMTNYVSGLAITNTVVVVNVAPADTTPPVITILGSSSNNVSWGSVYTDAGADAFDAGDDASVRVVTNNPVDTTVPGTYFVTYSATDSRTNTATANRQVTVAMAHGGTNKGIDGLSDIVRYAFGGTNTNPLSSNLMPSNSIAATNGTNYFVLTYFARTNSNVTLVPVLSTGLGGNDWTGNGITVTTLQTNVSTNGTTLEKRQAVTPRSGARKFLRLNATLK